MLLPPEATAGCSGARLSEFYEAGSKVVKFWPVRSRHSLMGVRCADYRDGFDCSSIGWFEGLGKNLLGPACLVRVQLCKFILPRALRELPAILA
jgi:hypothetical protein